MAKVSQMQGVPSHLETLKKRINGVIRQGVFFFIKGSKICDCPHNLSYYKCICGGSSKCDFYDERDAEN